MSKRVIRIPPLKKGRRVRWTFEVSADVEGKKSARASSATSKAKPSRRKRQASKSALNGEARLPIPPTTTRRAAKRPADAQVPTSVDAAPRALADSSVVAPPPLAVASGMTRWHAITLAAIVTLVVAALALPRRSALEHEQVSDSTPGAHDSTKQPIDAPPAVSASEPEPIAAPFLRTNAEVHVVASEPVKKPSPTPIQKSAAAPSTRPPVTPVVETHARETSEFEATRASIAPAAATAPAPAHPAPEASAVPEVTITGCLEAGASANRFRLTDTEGANAPKARSWRTGFLKKHSAAVDLVGAPDVAALQQQVGQRVAVSGVQTDRELKVSSVRVVSPSCN